MTLKQCLKLKLQELRYRKVRCRAFTSLKLPSQTFLKLF